MKNAYNTSMLVMALMMASGGALGHPGEHADEGILTMLAHLLGEHGYLLLLLLLVTGLVAWRRQTQRD